MKTIKIIFMSAGEMVFELLRILRQNVSVIGTLFMILWPALLVYWKIKPLEMAIVMIICLIVKEYFRRLDINLNNKSSDGFPVPNRRYTYDNGGMIDIRSEDISEALQYLYDLEEYLYKKGKIGDYGDGKSTM